MIRVLGWRIPWLSEAWGVAGGGTGRGVDGRGEGEGRAGVVGGGWRRETEVSLGSGGESQEPVW